MKWPFCSVVSLGILGMTIALSVTVAVGNELPPIRYLIEHGRAVIQSNKKTLTIENDLQLQNVNLSTVSSLLVLYSLDDWKSLRSLNAVKIGPDLYHMAIPISDLGQLPQKVSYTTRVIPTTGPAYGNRPLTEPDQEFILEPQFSLTKDYFAVAVTTNELTGSCNADTDLKASRRIYRINGLPWNEMPSGTCQFTINTSGLKNGRHSLAIKLYFENNTIERLYLFPFLVQKPLIH